MRERSPRTAAAGLPDLRRRGAVTELLFLFECTTEEPRQLRPIAEKLGLTVQAASHIFHQLSDRHLAEIREGRYLPTQAGVAWLHGALGVLREDVQGKLDRLHVIRSCRAVAISAVSEGDPVSLELAEGLLYARPGGAGPSRGRARTAARAGELLDVDSLQGIVPIARGRVTVLVVRSTPTGRRSPVAPLRQRLESLSPTLLAAQGLEAYHLLHRATRRPVVRFGVGAACREATQVGVDSVVVVTDGELPRLLAEFGGPDPPPVTVTTVE